MTGPIENGGFNTKKPQLSRVPEQNHPLKNRIRGTMATRAAGQSARCN
jgi:hypothetical protein